MRKKILLIIFLWSVGFLANAQHSHNNQGIKMSCPVCKSSGKVERARIPPPMEFMLKSGNAATSNIIVDYKGFPEEPKAAFARAVEIWESIIESEVPIRMEAKWTSLEEGVLGSCGPETFYSNFKDAPVKDRYYPVALAEKIAKEELNGESRYDMNANFNKDFAWYFGTDLNCPDTLHDFVSVVLHEIGHGLGFIDFFYVDDELGWYGSDNYGGMGSATAYDELVQSVSGDQLLDTSFYENISVGLKYALTSNALYANSPVAIKRNKNLRPKLYAPDQYDTGSSIAHLNELSYPSENSNSLMTPQIGYGEAIHDPGLITRGIMDDIGWRNLFIRHEPVKDKEQVEPLNFEVSLESDYNIDTTALWVIYSNDGFQSHSDSLKLKFSEESSVYVAELSPESGISEISYFVEAADTMNRVRTVPSNVPDEYYNVKFQVDNEAPIISHEAIPYFLKLGDPLTVNVNVEDNLGVDTVYIAFSVNGVSGTSFGLSMSTYGIYSGIFPIDFENLTDGDNIEYTVFAKDSSLALNRAQLPLNDEKFSFKVEDIFDPVTSYTNNFDVSGADFLLYDFKVYKERGFDNNALHSPHPYESGGSDNKDLEYWTFLKRPIILKDGGTMTYDEVVLVEPGEPFSSYGNSDFWDYVIVEASKDYGDTWLEMSTGYDAGSQLIWSDEYNEEIVEQVSQAKGKAELFFNREIDLLKSGNFVAGDTALIRFRLYSDPFASGWGWVIDNLQIQQAVSAGVISASNDVKVFPNPFNSSLNISIRSIENNSEIKIEVYDMFGKKVYAQRLENVFGELNETIQLNDLRSGMYLINITENGKLLRAKKLIKN